MHRGFTKGSRKVADSIRETGVLYAGHGWDGHGVYGHFLDSSHFHAFPHVVFEAEIDAEQLCRIPAATGDYFVIKCHDDLPIQVVRFGNLD